jgi:hypothetical protein
MGSLGPQRRFCPTKQGGVASAAPFSCTGVVNRAAGAAADTAAGSQATRVAAPPGSGRRRAVRRVELRVLFARHALTLFDVHP